MRREGVIVHLFRAPILFQGFVVMFLFFLNTAETYKRAGLGWIQLNCPGVFRLCALEVPSLLECHPQTIVAHLGIGEDFLHVAKFKDRLGGKAVIQQARCQVLPSIKPVGINALHFAIFANAGLKITFLVQAVTQIVVRLYVVRIERERLLKLRDRGVPVAFIRKRKRQVETCRLIIRF